MPAPQAHQHTQFTRLLTIWDRPDGKKMTNADRRHQREYLDKIEQTWWLCRNKPLKSFAIAISDKSDSMHVAMKYDRQLSRQYGLSPKVAVSKSKSNEITSDMMATLRRIHLT